MTLEKNCNFLYYMQHKRDTNNVKDTYNHVTTLEQFLNYL